MESIPKHLLYKQSLALFTDLYELTMAYGYWKTGMVSREAVFHLTFRKWPFNGGFAVCCGLQTLIDFIKDFRFTPCDLAYLESLRDSKDFPLFEKGFLDYLAGWKFSCDIDAIEEGSLVFPYEPLIRVKGPILEAQILESAILNIINFQTLIATKAARVCMAAGDDSVIEFGMRRAQGIDGAISASRASFVGGCSSTSHVLAGKLYGIPVKGTMAHSWVMAFEKEKDSFSSFSKVMPHNCVFLIDTYDSIQGVKNAIKVANDLKKDNFDLLGVRLDSGDLAHLSIQIRDILDQEGFKDAKIMASNELDEHLIRDLKQQGSKVTIWGVGTNLVTAKNQPALDGVYKLSCVQNEKGEWVDKIKISEQRAKVTIPGILQVRRFYNEHYLGDCLFDVRKNLENPISIFGIPDESTKKSFNEGVSYRDLLVPIFKQGECVYEERSLQEIQKRTKQELKYLDYRMKRFINPQPYFVGLEESLYQTRINLIEKLGKK